MKLRACLPLLTALLLGAAHAQSDTYTIRVPVLAAVHAPTTTSFDFGTVIVGGQPARQFNFVNRSASPTVIGAVQATGKARVLEHTCTGTLQPNEACQLTLGINADVLGTNTGSVAVSHSQGSTPDLYNLSAKAVSSSAAIRFDESIVNFGNQLIRTSSDERTLTLRNTGTEPAEVVSVAFKSPTFHYQISSNDCEGTLVPGGSCRVSVVFRPQALGGLSSALAYTLENGAVVTGVSLTGTGVQGVPTWSASELNFMEVPAGQESDPQTLTLTNTGLGTLTLVRVNIVDGTGESPYFWVKSTTCAGTLLPGASCTYSVVFQAPDTVIRNATLQLTASGTTSTTTRVQMWARPVAYEPLLSVAPLSLAFGDTAVGQAKTLSLTLKSVGQAPVTVSAYALSGAAASDYALLNAGQCTGTLNPGMQCVLQVRAMPSAAGLRSATLSLTHTSSQSVAPVSLSANGLLGELQVTPASLSFSPIDTGTTASLPLVLKNVGAANLNITSLTSGSSATGVATMFQPGGTCTGQTLAVGDSCTVNVVYAPTTVGSHSASLAIRHTGQGGLASVAMTGSANLPPQAVASLSDFVCPPVAQVGVATVCSATLSNPSTVAFTVTGVGTSSNAAFVPSFSGCTPGATLNPGQSCAVRLTVTPAAAGTLSTNYQLLTSAQSLNKAVALNVQTPRATLSTAAHGNVQIGKTANATHTVTNTGNLPVTLTLPPVLAATGSSAFSVVSHTCASTLAVGASCEVVTRCAPTSTGSLTRGLTLTSNSTPGLTGTLSCEGLPADANSGLMTIAPNPVAFPATPVGSTSPVVTVTVRNGNAAGTADVLVSGVQFSGTNPGVFSVLSTTCYTATGPTRLAPGATCALSMTARPVIRDLNSAVLQVNTSVVGTQPQAALSVMGQQASFNVSPTLQSFGSMTAGSSASPRYFQVLNSGTLAGSLSSVSVVPGSSPAFRFTNYCPASIASGANCSVGVDLDPTKTAGQTGTLSASATLQFSQGPAVTVTAEVNLLPAPVAAGTVSVSCPSTVPVGTSTSCQVRVNSTGTANLVLSNWGLSQQLGSGTAVALNPSSVTCSSTGVLASSLPPGQFCTGVASFVPAAAGTYTVRATPQANATLTPAQATLMAQGAVLQLNTSNHPLTQLGSSTTATHTLVNTGPVAVTVTGATSSAGGITVNALSCGVLASGQSCPVTTKCTPSMAGTLSSTVQVNGSPTVSAAGPVSCVAQAPSVTVTAEPSQTTVAGGFSTSGNWMRLTNTGVGPVTVQGFYPAVGWALVGSSTLSSNCAVNKVLQASESCIFMELLTGTTGPGATAGGTQRLRSSAGDSSWVSTPIALKGLAFSVRTPFPAVQVGDVATAVYDLTNTAPTATALPMTFGGLSAGLTVQSHNCPAALAAGATCQVTLQYQAPAYATSFSATVTASTGYDARVNNQTQTGTARNGVQGSLNLSFPVAAAKLVLTPGTNSRIYVGQTVDILHVLRNDGVSGVRITSAPALSSTSQHTVAGGSCALNTSLPAGQSCTVVTRFAPTVAAQSAVTLSIGTSAGLVSGTFVGQTVPQSEVALTLNGPVTGLADGNGTYNLGVTNSYGGVARVVVNFGATNSGGAQAYIAGLNGGTCGTWSFTASGSASQTAAATAGTVSCSARPGMKQLELVIPAGGAYSASLVVSNQSVPGSVTVSASATVSDVQDLNSGNNAASVVTAISYPAADVAVSLSTSPTTVSYSWTGNLTVTVSNLSSGPLAAAGANATAALSWAGVTGNPSITFGTPVCSSATTGATCNSSGQVYLPAGGRVTFTVPYTTGAGLGDVDVRATAALVSSGVTDSNTGNNSATVRLKVDEVLVEKTCMFTSPQKGKYLGLTTPDGSKNGWATIGPFNKWGIPMMYNWLEWHLFNGWASQTASYDSGPAYTGMYLDPRYATWKGSGKPVAATRMMDGSYQITLTTVRPIVEYLYNGKWTRHWVNYRSGELVGGALAYSDYACGSGPGAYYQECPYNLLGKVTGAVLPIGGGYQGVWKPQSDSKAWVNYRSQGSDVNGVQYRQVWIEKSPGPSCNATGTTLATY